VRSAGYLGGGGDACSGAVAVPLIVPRTSSLERLPVRPAPRGLPDLGELLGRERAASAGHGGSLPAALTRPPSPRRSRGTLARVTGDAPAISACAVASGHGHAR